MRINEDLGGLSVLQAHGLDEVALAQDQDVRVPVRLKLVVLITVAVTGEASGLRIN